MNEREPGTDEEDGASDGNRLIETPDGKPVPGYTYEPSPEESAERERWIAEAVARMKAKGPILTMRVPPPPFPWLGEAFND